ncbi:MAG TPA: hypothetical protein VHB79_38885 [Polyangiaceae bacterium]|nr:hypothetical protein [Polyangiaceae bacterium]
MTWSARIEHTPAGLALTFGAPLSRLDMAPEVAQHLASLLAVEARHRMAGVVRELVETRQTGDDGFNPVRAENKPNALTVRRSQKRLYVGSTDASRGDRREAILNIQLAENMPVQVIGSVHALCCDCDACLNGVRP